MTTKPAKTSAVRSSTQELVASSASRRPAGPAGKETREPPSPPATERPSRSPKRPHKSAQEEPESEFWETWAEERNQERKRGPSAQPEATPVAMPMPAISPMPAMPMTVTADPSKQTRTSQLYLNVGRRDRVGAQKIRSLVTDKTGVFVEKLEVRGNHSYLWVPEEVALDVTAAVSGAELGGRTLVCEPARREASRTEPSWPADPSNTADPADAAYPADPVPADDDQ